MSRREDARCNASSHQTKSNNSNTNFHTHLPMSVNNALRYLRHGVDLDLDTVGEHRLNRSPRRLYPWKKRRVHGIEPVKIVDVGKMNRTLDDMIHATLRRLHDLLYMR